MWRGIKSGDIGIADSEGKFKSNKGRNIERSAVYFVLSPEWKAAVTEKEKVYLFVFALLYFTSLAVFTHSLMSDIIMVHSLQLKVFLNTETYTPILQKVNLKAEVTFTTGIWYKNAIISVKPQNNSRTYVGTYPLIYERLIEAYVVYYTCLEGHFRTSPALTTSILFLIAGSIVYTFAGPLVILSRSAFYRCATIGAILLAFFVMLNHAACNFLYDCLQRSQATQLSDSGTYAENIHGTTLFDIIPSMEEATTIKIATYLTILEFLPIAIMGSLAEKMLGRPV
ncbi:hypothetical protein TcWFU_000697 [Taenia crassiceps]|uniref:Uncharacterized protein n=1 Tax=Taenia crassiceps TaxID=6207 RepID=A0ABR4QNG8_9CEST